MSETQQQIDQLTRERDEALIQRDEARCRADMNDLAAEKATKERDEAQAKCAYEKKWFEDAAKQICEMEDALGFRQDQHDKDGAFIPTMGPWKERVRDLIAKEAELTEAHESLDAEKAKMCILAAELDATRAQLTKAQAKCVEMREVLLAVQYSRNKTMAWNECPVCGYVQGNADEHADTCSIKHALSSDCGKGFLSPEKAGRLREAYDELREFTRTACLKIQQHSSLTDRQFTELFRESYRLYTKHDVENRGANQSLAETEAQ